MRPALSDDGAMSLTSAPDTGPAPPPQQPTPRRGMGSLRSLVISTVVILAAVLVWFMMVPRPSLIEQPAVDVAAVALRVRQETSWAISAPRLPVGWKATNVRFSAAGDGLRTWHAGYLSPEGNYVSIDQTRGATDLWVSAQTSGGESEGSLGAAGRTWQKLSSRDTVQRSLVSRGTGDLELSTVVSGTAPYTQLAQFAEALVPVPSR